MIVGQIATIAVATLKIVKAHEAHQLEGQRVSDSCVYCGQEKINAIRSHRVENQDKFGPR